MNTLSIFNQNPEFPMAHCATLAVLQNGALMSAWYAGKDECAPDVSIFLSELTGAAWSRPRIIARVAGLSLGQPVLLPLKSGSLILFFVMVPENGGWPQAQPYSQRSLDGGVSWSTPLALMDYPGLMFRARPLILENRIILPVYDEKTWQSRMLISDDEARSWKMTGPIITPQGNIQPSLACLDDGRLLAYLRTGGDGGWIWRTTSSDRGENWESPTPTRLPNPNSGIDLLRTRSGQLVVAYNPSTTQRSLLTVSVASQQENWLTPRVIEAGPEEYSYPALAQTPDDQIHLVYTWRRQSIKYIVFTEKWLIQ